MFLKFIVSFIAIPSKFKLDFIKSMLFGDVAEFPPLPWMNYKVINYIDRKIKASPCVFEYGSGCSTLYWASRGAKIISVEHDTMFYNKLSMKLDDNVRYHLVEPQVESALKPHMPEDPAMYHSDDYEGYSFESYVKSIDVYPDEYFDVVVVDGRSRPACIKHALPKIKKGGMLVLDNSDRSYYTRQTSPLLKDWTAKTFRGLVRGLMHQEQTTIYVRP